jgi:hypothetical protein
MIIRLATTSDAPELKKLNDLFNGDGDSLNTVEGSVLIDCINHTPFLYFNRHRVVNFH